MLGLVKTWFHDYHPWHPILHQPSLEDYLQIQICGDEANDSQSLIIRAIAAVIMPYEYPDQSLSQADRLSWSTALRGAVVSTAINDLSFHGLQALLILAILDYGSGNLPSFWNLIGLCQR